MWLFNIPDRYAPKTHPEYMNFSVDGVKLADQTFNCDNTRCSVKLEQLRPQTTGLYRCEISGDKPNFVIISGTANMSVAGKFSLMSFRCFIFMFTLFIYVDICDIFVVVICNSVLFSSSLDYTHFVSLFMPLFHHAHSPSPTRPISFFFVLLFFSYCLSSIEGNVCHSLCVYLPPGCLRLPTNVSSLLLLFLNFCLWMLYTYLFTVNFQFSPIFSSFAVCECRLSDK